jgi:branched-chain amino acid transport system ATP-binding protein
MPENQTHAVSTVSSALLQVRELSRHFGGYRAVHKVSFSLASGAICGLIGPNGAGKTTLFNCLAGFMRPTTGQVWLDGVPIAGASPAKIFASGLARTFQIPRPFPEMSVLENVMRDTREAARHWLSFVGLSDLEQKPARVLSGGQRKLLELARVMVARPKLVLLDEPGAGVNPALLDQIVDKITALNAQGTTFLIIEHNMDLVASLCRPVMVMAQGELLVSGDADTVLADPRVVEAYLGTA